MKMLLSALLLSLIPVALAVSGMDYYLGSSFNSTINETSYGTYLLVNVSMRCTITILLYACSVFFSCLPDFIERCLTYCRKISVCVLYLVLEMESKFCYQISIVGQ